MNHTSTVTSKGTITLPASFRRKLGITEGKKVTITLKDDTIQVTPQGGWEDVLQAGDALRAGLRERQVAYDVATLPRRAEKIKIADYKRGLHGK